MLVIVPFVKGSVSLHRTLKSKAFNSSVFLGALAPGVFIARLALWVHTYQLLVMLRAQMLMLWLPVLLGALSNNKTMVLTVFLRPAELSHFPLLK